MDYSLAIPAMGCFQDRRNWVKSMHVPPHIFKNSVRPNSTRRFRHTDLIFTTHEHVASEIIDFYSRYA